ncbi:MAG: hypothetical protein IPK60_11985 [Sandaracinaceae bacterium]|nr:hypothetical protein [Sandaracinaceae bacterium]
MRRDSSVPDLGALPASNGSCTGPHSPSDVLRCLQYPASIAEATVRSQCDTAGETFAVTCPTEDLFGACIYESQSWWFYEPASEEQRAQASGSCGGGTWVEY